MIEFNVKFINSRFCLIFTVLLSEMLGAESRNKINTEPYDCNKFLSQTSYSLRDMTGAWYGIQIIDNVNRHRPPIDSCIKIELQQDRINEKIINLIWQERNLDITYRFIIANKDQLGVWTSLGNQDVNEKPNGYDYEQFAGKVYVMKASDGNSVLTFCSGTKLFSLVLSKTYTMNSTELESIHGLLNRFGVPESKSNKTFCKNSGVTMEPHIFMILIVIAIVFTSRARFCKV